MTWWDGPLARRRHPRGAALMAWHDGELGDATVGAHIEGCSKCWARVAMFASVDNAVRSTADRRSSTGRHHTALRDRGARRIATPVVVLAGVVFIASTLAPAVSVDLSRSRIASFFNPARTTDRGSSAKATTATRHRAAATTTTTLDQPAGLRSSGHQRDPALASPTPLPMVAETLTIAVPLPGGEASRVPDADDIQRAVRGAVAAANAGGGVGGKPIAVKVIDSRTMATSPTDAYDILVGGLPDDRQTSPTPAPFAGQPWLFPADPTVHGSSVLSLDPEPGEAGRLLAAAFAIGATAAVGILDDGGTQRRFGDALANRTGPTERFSTPPTASCDAAVLAARRRGVTTLVFALDPGRLADCAAALGRSAWVPSGGVFLPTPSGYIVPKGLPVGVRFRTLLGLPWPAWDEPAVARFRTVAKSAAYRALVSFAATEFAIAAARSNAGRVDLDAVARSSWRTDLIAFDGLTNVALRPAQAGLLGWDSWPSP